MSTIPFNHLKSKTIQQQPTPEPKRSIWQFFKSQLGLFGGTPEHKPMHNIPFASQKEKTEHNIGEVKSENGKQYIFLETTIGKPRWHSHEELITMAKEGKPIPEIAKKKMPSIAEIEKKKAEELIAKRGDTVVSEGQEFKITEVRTDKRGKHEYISKYKNAKGNKETAYLDEDGITIVNGKKTKYFESEQKRMAEEKAESEAKKKEEKKPEPTDQLSENINKKIVEQGEKEKPTLKKLMEVQSNVLKLAEIPEKDMAMYALSSMADGAKLRSYSTEVIKGEMTAEQAAEKVKSDYKKMVESEKKEEPTSIDKAKEDIKRAKELMAEAPETAEPNSGIKTKADHQKYIDETQAWIDKKEKKVQPEASTEQKVDEYVAKAKEIQKQKADLYAEMEKKPDSERFKEIQQELGRLEKEDGVLYKNFAKNAKVGDVKTAESKLKEPDIDTLPLLPSEKDSKEGDTKSINGITYELKRGESGELRWHRVTEEEKGLEKLSDKELSEAVDKDWKENVIPHDPGNGKSNEKFSGAIKEHKERMKGHKDILAKRMSERIKKHKEERDQAYSEAKGKYEGKIATLTNDIDMGRGKLKAGQKISIKNIYFTLGDVHTIGSMGIKAVDDRGRNIEMSLQKLIDNSSLKEKPKEPEPVVMPRQEAIEEHKNLVKVLENGTEEERKAEAEKQAKELEGYEEGTDEGQPEETLSELVEERLNEKQEGKKFKDIGTRVGGSKKEMAAIRVLTADDLMKLDNATAYKVVTKERILPDIDAEAEKANGVESGAAYLKKKLRDAINAKPSNSAEERKRFVEIVPKVFEMINGVKTIEELSNLAREKFDIWHSFRSSKVQLFLKGDEKNNISELFGKEFCNLLGRDSDSAKTHWMNARLMNSMSEETSQQRYKEYEESRKEMLEKNKKRIDEYTPEQWENYFKNDPATTFVFNRRQLSAMKKDDPTKYQEAIDKFKEREYKRNEDRNAILPYEKWLSQNSRYITREENWSWADEKDKRVIQKMKDELKIHDNPPLDFIKRTNGREVKDSDISADALTNKYGFKSVQLGNYVKDTEAKEHIRHFIESMNDLEDALGIDIKKMNELSGLSIAFGARGGGKALAHYEPMAKIINITKTQGDGSVAHELFHNIDHMLGGMREGSRNENVFLSQSPSYNKGKLGEAMQDVMDAIKHGKNVIPKTFQPDEQKYTYGSIRRMFEDKGYEYTKEYLMKRYAGDPNKLGNAEDYFKYLATLSKKPIEVLFDTGRTKFYDGALSFKSDYWRRPLEMFARAAEAYVQDKVESKGMYNNYLVGGNNIQKPDMKWKASNLELAYPEGEERIRINEAFDKLIEAAKEELNIGVDKPKEGKRISSEVQMQKSLYNPSIFQTIFKHLN